MWLVILPKCAPHLALVPTALAQKWLLKRIHALGSLWGDYSLLGQIPNTLVGFHKHLELLAAGKQFMAQLYAWEAGGVKLKYTSLTQGGI